MKIMLIAGARPNFMKIASIVDAIKLRNDFIRDSQFKIQYKLIHTGQHYDKLMSDVFFKDLGLPEPDIHLGVGSSSHAHQTAEIMRRFEPVLLEEEPDIVIVVGDVNSTVACSLVASKIECQTRKSKLITRNMQRRKPLIAHVEAGLRSFDRSMPEEINRILTDAISDYLFITEKSAEENLLREGIPKKKIYFVGNTMVDTLLQHRDKAKKSKILFQVGLKNNRDKKVRKYAVLTLHRPSNVDNRRTFKGILDALSVISKEVPIYFPVHPRTLNRIREFRFDKYFYFLTPNAKPQTCNSRIYCLEPFGYLDFLCLMSHARLLLTDSGGIQEETTVLGVPCVTLRHNTERPVTANHGTNVIAGTEKEKIIQYALGQLNATPRRRKIKFWDGQAGDRIIKILTTKRFNP
jgi:UDP-N-acetylglucosamine 2-epimerase (non-hydrolysing)